MELIYHQKAYFKLKKDLYKFKSEEKIELELMVADTAKLPFQNEEFELIYSMGVLHHTNDITTSVSEIKRVLSIDGTAYFALYRTFSLKVLIALAIRKIQYLCDKILNKNIVFSGSIENLLQSFLSALWGRLFLSV